MGELVGQEPEPLAPLRPRPFLVQQELTPLADAELTAKIEDCLAYAPPGSTTLDATGLRRAVDELPVMSDIGALIAALAPGS